MSDLKNDITCNYNKTIQELKELSLIKTTLQKDLDDMKSRNESLEKRLKEVVLLNESSLSSWIVLA